VGAWICQNTNISTSSNIEHSSTLHSLADGTADSTVYSKAALSELYSLFLWVAFIDGGGRDSSVGIATRYSVI
jgi:hypothetical protein